MEKEFIPYEQALDLKELGFDKPCIKEYHLEELLNNSTDGEIKNSDLMELYGNSVISAPTFSQAFRWFRENDKYDITIPPSGDSSGNTIGYYYEIIFQGWGDGIESDSYDTYEEAELECLKKLIEIVKEK
jgi:hypothetical protein